MNPWAAGREAGPNGYSMKGQQKKVEDADAEAIVAAVTAVTDLDTLDLSGNTFSKGSCEVSLRFPRWRRGFYRDLAPY